MKIKRPSSFKIKNATVKRSGFQRKKKFNPDNPAAAGRSLFISFLSLFVLTAGIVQMQNHIKELLKYGSFTDTLNETDAFRSLAVSTDNYNMIQAYAEENGMDDFDLLSVSFYMNDLDLVSDPLNESKLQVYKDIYEELKAKKEAELSMLSESLRAIWKDIRYFPVPASLINDKATVSFDNSWMFERNYGGTRGHEGTDIMASINERGYYPVLSITDGEVENIGWLPKGGYRIGIRSPSGGYFYYAHLYDYAEDYQKGDQIQAGELIGFMGDSGYGEEGTVGQFAVHLHLGIYIETQNNEELSVNPYWVLKKLEDKKLSYRY